MRKPQWNERDTQMLVRQMNLTHDPVETACAVAAASFGLLAHYRATDLSRKLIAELQAIIDRGAGK